MPTTLFSIMVNHKRETFVEVVNYFGASSSFIRRSINQQEFVIFDVRMTPKKDCTQEEKSAVNTHRFAEGLMGLLIRMMIG
jgi:hypothetical protein